MSDETDITDEELRSAEGLETDEGQEAGHSTYNPVKDDNGMIRHQLSGMYQGWFLDYASYVILERAVPHFVDGLKPVQRRTLYDMRELVHASAQTVGRVSSVYGVEDRIKRQGKILVVHVGLGERTGFHLAHIACDVYHMGLGQGIDYCRLPLVKVFDGVVGTSCQL